MNRVLPSAGQVFKYLAGPASLGMVVLVALAGLL